MDAAAAVGHDDPAREYAFLAERTGHRRIGAGPAHASLDAVLGKSEFQAFVGEIDIRPAPLGVPLYVPAQGAIQVSDSLLGERDLLAFHVRHAIERASWEAAARPLRNHAAFQAAAVLAFHTALLYVRTLPTAARQRTLNGLPGEYADAYRRLCDLDEQSASDEVKSQYLVSLLPLLNGLSENGQDFAAPSHETAMRVTQALALAQPVESLLTAGGDKRLQLSPETGLNKYGCSPKPRPWAATFSTCTASSISVPGYRAAERFRRTLFPAALNGNLDQQYARQADRIRSELATALGIDAIPGAQVVLTASGTDAELLAVHCALKDSPRAVTNIVVAPKEVGSGTMYAAGGRHFDPHPPLGSTVTPGEPIEGFDAARIEVVPLDIRDENGRARTSQEMDALLRQQVKQACDAGKLVIVHLLDCSKTGCGGPSLKTLTDMQALHADALTVIVDAAQMRVSRRMLANYLRHGFMVIATGSKFFTGPPFSGALFVPPELTPDGTVLPRGLREYCARTDLPRGWLGESVAWPAMANLGLMLRWRAALWELKAFFSVAAQDRRAIFHAFAVGMSRQFDAVPEVEPLPCEIYVRQYHHDDDDWDHVPTIFSFYVRRRGSGDSVETYLDYEQAGKVYHWLNADISARLPAAATTPERDLARHCCHIGQPVRINTGEGECRGALRIAVGARLVSRVAYDPALGASREARISQQITSARGILDKVALICRYWNELESAAAEGDPRCAGVQTKAGPPASDTLEAS